MTDYGLEIRSSIDSSILVSTSVPIMLFLGKGTLISSTLIPFRAYLIDPWPNNGWILLADVITYPNNICEHHYSLIGSPGSKYETTLSGFQRLAASGTYATSKQYTHKFKCSVQGTQENPHVCFVNVAPNTNFYASTPYYVSGYYYVDVVSYSQTAPTVYWFYTPKNLPASNDPYGLRIYNSEQALLFDSGWGTFGAAQQIVSLPFLDNQSVSTSLISKPGFLYSLSYISLEIMWGCYEEYQMFTSGYTFDKHIITNNGACIKYSRFLKYVNGNGTIVSIRDLAMAVEDRISTPNPYTVFEDPLATPQNAGIWGGSSPSGGTLYVPIIDCALYD